MSTDAAETVRAFLQGAPDVAERPALGKLSADQTSLLAELLTGFDDREAVLRWMQGVAMQSLGELPDEWYLAQLSESSVMSAFLGRPWGLVTPEGYDERMAKQIRRDIATKDLLGAFYDATSTFRWSAAERYQDDDLEEMDPEEMDYDDQSPAMRPAFADKNDQQAWALRRLLDGFETMDEFVLWGHYVVRVTYAEIDRETIRDAYFDANVRTVLLGEDDEARFWRETWAAKYLLPGFNRAAATLAGRSAEQVKRSSGALDAPR